MEHFRVNERTATHIDHRIGLLLRRRRLELEMSQERLAELLGVTFQQVQKYEKGVNRVAASRLFDICRSLDVTPAYFYDQIKGSGAVNLVDEALAEPEAVQLLNAFATIKDRRLRKRALDLVRALEEESQGRRKKR